MDTREIEHKLKEPFATDDVEFRISHVHKNNTRATVLAYITSRAVMDRLDAILGVDGWHDAYEVIDGGVICTLTLKIGDTWVTKQDTAPFTNIEALKGGFSDSLKRAAVKFGIGRYLYQLPNYQVDLQKDVPYNVPREKVHFHYSRDASGYWVEPKLPSWAVKVAQTEQRPEKEVSHVPSEPERPATIHELPDDREKMQTLLLDYTETLFQQKALTEKRRTDFIRKINRAGSSIGLLKYYYRQYSLIDRLYALIREGVVSEPERVNIYKDILGANNQRLQEIEDSLQQLAA